MKISGYMNEVEWDGATLTARGTNKASRIALAGEDHAAGDVVIPRGAMASVRFKDASRLVNGNLTISTEQGRRYQLHFRRKHADDFRALAAELGAL